MAFFISGFLWDSLTLGRIDWLYDTVILSTYTTLLTISIYNLVDGDQWENTLFRKYDVYLPLAVQFFLGGLSSAYVIYFLEAIRFLKQPLFFNIDFSVICE